MAGMWQVMKDAEGWVVLRGTERVAGPFGSKSDADAAMLQLLRRKGRGSEVRKLDGAR